MGRSKLIVLAQNTTFKSGENRKAHYNRAGRVSGVALNGLRGAGHIGSQVIQNLKVTRIHICPWKIISQTLILSPERGRVVCG
jgi:phosphoglycerate dehydrogenase-like enzyme